MKRHTLCLSLLIFLLGAVGVNAQTPNIPIEEPLPALGPSIPALRVAVFDPQSFPGQVWNDTGNISPVEHGDVISASYAEQGVTLMRFNTMSIMPYAAVGVTADTQHNSWNNRVVSSVGGRVNKYFGTYGIVSIGGAYTYEDRWAGGLKKGGLSSQVTYWFGWNMIGNEASRFPGSTWGVAGYLSPVESHNLVYNQYFKQGVVAKRFSARDAIMPFAEITTFVDTKGYDWENRVLPGAGVEWVHLRGNSQIELGAMYLEEHRWISGTTAGQATLFLKYWFGWNPIRGRAR